MCVLIGTLHYECTPPVIASETSTRIVHRCVRTKYEEILISTEHKDIFGKIKFDSLSEILVRYGGDIG